MKLFRRIELGNFVLLVLSVSVLYVIFFWGYYFVRPSYKGEEILAKKNLPYPTVIAHRGASYEAPESTGPAYRTAGDMGVNYVEADIQRTKDGKLVVVHDKTLKRTSNIEEVYPERKDDHVDNFTYEELLQLDFGSWFNKKYPLRAQKKYAGLKILTLEDLIKITEEENYQTGIILDLKLDERHVGIVDEIIGLIEKHSRGSENSKEFADVIVFSFYLGILKNFKEKAPEIPRVLLIDDNRISRRRWSKWLDYAENHVDGLGIKGFVSWPWHIAEAHNRDLFVFPYVIKKLWHLRVLSHIKSSGYITNRPEMVQRFLNIVLPQNRNSD